MSAEQYDGPDGTIANRWPEMSPKKIGYYVLWTSRYNGQGFWIGPFATLSEASRQTPMRDKTAQAFVLHYAGPMTS